MKIVFIHAKSKAKLARLSNIDILPKNIGLVSTVQFSEQLKELQKMLKAEGKNIILGKSRKTSYEGQILGCDISAAESIADKVDCFLFLGDGMFHPKMLLLKLNKPVFRLMPGESRITKIEDSDIDKIRKMQKAAYVKYLSSKEIGIIVSTKPGQNNIKKAIALKQEIEKQRKNAYILVFETIDFNELENFPFIECFVNTACPRIGVDDQSRITKPIIDIEDIKK